MNQYKAKELKEKEQELQKLNEDLKVGRTRKTSSYKTELANTALHFSHSHKYFSTYITICL